MKYTVHRFFRDTKYFLNDYLLQYRNIYDRNEDERRLTRFQCCEALIVA